MKAKYLLSVLLILVIVNIVAVDTYLYYQIAGSRTALPPVPEAAQGSRPLAMLTDSQREKLRGIMEEYRKETGEINGRIRNLDDTIFRLLRAEPVMRDSIDRYLKEIGALRIQLQTIAIGKMIETKSYLSGEQQEQLFAAIFRTKSRAGLEESRRGQERWPEQIGGRLAELASRLGLSPSQTDEVGRILADTRRKMDAADSAGRTSGSAGVTRKAIKDEEDARILKILNGDQRKKFEEMKREGKSRPQPPPGDDSPPGS